MISTLVVFNLDHGGDRLSHLVPARSHSVYPSSQVIRQTAPFAPRSCRPWAPPRSRQPCRRHRERHVIYSGALSHFTQKATTHHPRGPRQPSNSGAGGRAKSDHASWGHTPAVGPAVVLATTPGVLASRGPSAATPAAASHWRIPSLSVGDGLGAKRLTLAPYALDQNLSKRFVFLPSERNRLLFFFLVCFLHTTVQTFLCQTPAKYHRPSCEHCDPRVGRSPSKSAPRSGFMTQSLVLSIDVCRGLGISPLRSIKCFAQAAIGPTSRQELIFFFLVFFFNISEKKKTEIRCHGERYKIVRRVYSKHKLPFLSR